MSSLPQWKISRYLIERRHTALLVAIVSALCVRPLIGDAGRGPLVFSLVMLGLLLVALVTLQVDELEGERHVLLAEKRRHSLAAWVLAVPPIVTRLWLIVAPGPRLYTAAAVAWFVFFAFITWSQLRSLLRHRTVTGETISLSIAVYLLIGVTWGLLYGVIFELDPAAFNLGPGMDPDIHWTERQMKVFPVFVYFSLTTLSTVGFGDITPLSLAARYAAVAEGILGQFYLAILVARLVAMHMIHSTRADR